jgi:hypothetical protein
MKSLPLAILAIAEASSFAGLTMASPTLFREGDFTMQRIEP